jgi:hypothetical protein
VKLCFAALAFLATVPITVEAGEVRTSFAVSAVVPARASLVVVSQPELLSVSRDDLARGYVQIAAVYRVKNNDPAGFLVRLAPRSGVASAVEVSGLSAPVVMRDEVVEVTEPAALEVRDLNLVLRLTLDPGAPAGVYPMPLQVSVAAL